MPTSLQELSLPHAASLKPAPVIARDTFNRPLHDLRISVIDQCNFRCNYCMPSEEYHEGYSFLKKDQWLTFDEITRLAKIFSTLGVSKIRVTGGEPLLRQNLPSLIERLSELSRVEDIALTTNGIFLAKCAPQLKSAGLKRLTISLDTLNDETFHRMNGNRGSVEDVLRGINAAQNAGFHSIKINAVIQKGINDGDILNLVRYFKKSGHILRFIEYMDVGNRNHWDLARVVPSKEILKHIQTEFPLRTLEPNYHGEVAERYAFEDGEGEIGFISSITQPFCRTCTRARLSTDGKFFTCLFASDGVDLRDPLRNGASDQDLLELICGVWQKREDRYSEIRLKTSPQEKRPRKIEMYQIGG